MRTGSRRRRSGVQHLRRVVVVATIAGRVTVAEVPIGPACDLGSLEVVVRLVRVARVEGSSVHLVSVPPGFAGLLAACGLHWAVLGGHARSRRSGHAGSRRSGHDDRMQPDEPAPHDPPAAPVRRPEPMTAELGELPVDDEGWCYEPKWDGMRVLAEVDHGALRLWSRSGRDVTVTFPELAPLADVAPRAVLDGEVVALDGSGRPSFARLQQRFGVEDPAEAARRASRVPAQVVLFDLLVLDGLEAWRLPYERRRALLESLIEPEGVVQVTPSWRGEGARWLAAAREAGMEGLVAKRADAPYRPGRRSGAWRKVKLRQEQEFAVCGWLPGQGRRAGGVGSLVLGCGPPGHRSWVGNAGSGLGDADLELWQELLAGAVVAESPFGRGLRHAALRDARWVRPEHVVQVAFGEWTDEGRLRHPTVLGRRFDVDVDAVNCEGRPTSG